MAKKKRKLTAWQRHVKSYMAAHKGLSFKEALPKAKLTYRKSKIRTRSGSSNPRPKKAGKVKRRMARRYTRRRRRRSRQITVPLAVVAPLVASNVGAVMNMVRDPSPDSVAASLSHIGAIYTGYSAIEGRFAPEMLAQGLLPLVAGLLVHKFVGGAPLNLNRILARHNIPFIRI